VSEGPDEPDLRLRVLVRVVQRLLRVVVIELDEHDNAQLIFETLNARGEDLLAAELVKNFLFQHADRPASIWRDSTQATGRSSTVPRGGRRSESAAASAHASSSSSSTG
jgi:hypothetical protein